MADKYFADEEDGINLDIPKEKRHLNTASYDYSVEFLYDLMKGDNAKVILNVPFQRKFIWDHQRSSRLIESLIMNVPIPPVYFAEEDDKKWLVVDGLQRLSTIKTYFENEYPLKGLEIIKEIESLKFKDLPPKAKSMLTDALMRAIVIKSDSHPDIKFDIFMRLNKGAVTLNYQELRNCMYRGHLLDQLKKSIERKKFLDLLQQKKCHERYLDLELALRLLALCNNIRRNGDVIEIKDYAGSLVTYINTWMESVNKAWSNSEIDNMISIFDNVIDYIHDNLGVDAFRNHWQSSKSINRAVADYTFVAVYSFLGASNEVNQKIKDVLLSIGESDALFQDSVNIRPSHKKALNYRMTKVLLTIDPQFML